MGSPSSSRQFVSGWGGLVFAVANWTFGDKSESEAGKVYIYNLVTNNELENSRRITLKPVASTGHSTVYAGSQKMSQMVSTGLHGALDVAGIWDPTGICDGANALLYASEGNLADASLSAVAMIPYVGDLAKLIKNGERFGGVYLIFTKTDHYTGQSIDFLTRMRQHFRRSKPKFRPEDVMDIKFYRMDGATKLEREVAEQYLIIKFGRGQNKINPMGGRMDEYYKHLESVINKYNLPR